METCCDLCDKAQVLNQWLVLTPYKPICNNKIPFRSLPQPIGTPKIHLAHKTRLIVHLSSLHLRLDETKMQEVLIPI
jgi:hypothetical protein